MQLSAYDLWCPDTEWIWQGHVMDTACMDFKHKE